MPAVRPGAKRWTIDMLDELPDDGNRYELIDGELFVTPAPSNVHQLVVLALATRLRAYLRPTSLARVLISPSDVRREDRRENRVQPDVFAVKLIEGKWPAYPFDLRDLLLPVEVLSPSNPKYDYQTKRELYFNAGISEYWIVDSEAQTFARWRGVADPGELLTERIEWQPSGLGVPLVIELPEFFQEALG